MSSYEVDCLLDFNSTHPKRVGHLVLNVSDLEASTKFYTNILGFQISLERKDASGSGSSTFLTCGKIHHDLALFQAKEGAAPVSPGGLGLNHMALQVEDFDTLKEYYIILQHLHVIDRCTDHGMTCSIYLTDPDGNGIELFCNCQKDAAEGLAVMGSPDRENKELVFDSAVGMDIV